ncbi:hypothetical protein N7481_011885 [Penicillium waksmanii]|uniref:uncharacterized protein n=1 Tax=Penicillium waksmanii TaxID=69791 RepID=UPI002548B2EB|nr:uncharacterized protein N7481_011885 [Penicillium waksmanii]KAJ5974675.1 hypothetical protein N7481_011885 [Penicillium waksmanii]
MHFAQCQLRLKITVTLSETLLLGMLDYRSMTVAAFWNSTPHNCCPNDEAIIKRIFPVPTTNAMFL